MLSHNICAPYTLQVIEKPSSLYNTHHKTDCLCVEIGGKRIIAAYISQNPTIEDLKNTKIWEFDSRPWFTQLPQLFTNDSSPLAFLFQMPHSSISVSIFGPLYDSEGLIDVANHHIPRYVKDDCLKVVDSNFSMHTDTLCWSKGCLELQKIKNQMPDSSLPDSPFLVIILKGGVGVALVEPKTDVTKEKITAIELPYTGCNFPKLQKVCESQGQEFTKFSIHDALGNRFFYWALQTRDFKEEDVTPYIPLYNERFKEFALEIKEHIESLFDMPNLKVYVGGERCVFLTEPIPNVTYFNIQSFKDDQLSPDIIQLLGASKLFDSSQTITTTFPSYDVISSQR
ncbi:MAG: hypothetical protein JHC93_07595 [Parachlamydiales bacterium]|nr:hypothetical protein [Parachlamydiales bacterium]